MNFKLFDHLANEELSLEELAKKLNLPHLSPLERFLNACKALQLIKQDENNKRYSNTQLSNQYLVTTSPDTLSGYVSHNSQAVYYLWNELSNGIRENGPQWERVFKSTHHDEFKFDAFYRNENAETIFMSGMHGLGLTCFPSIISSIDNFQQYKTLCDLGGATGSLAVTACKANPNLQAIIFDLPTIEKHAIKFLNQNPSDIRDRVRFQAGDFFTDPLPQVEIFALGRILHDWDDDKCELLLKKVYESLPEKNGMVLIAEKILFEDKSGPISANMQDLNMLVGTKGRERSFSEYKDMLERVGFKNIKRTQLESYLEGIFGYK